MSDNPDLKSFAVEAAAGNTPQDPPADKEKTTTPAEETTNTPEGVVNVGGTPIVVGPPKKKKAAPPMSPADQMANALMNTPNPDPAENGMPAPVPVSTGLDDSALDSSIPKELLKDGPRNDTNDPSTMPVYDRYEDNGDFTPDQKALIDELLTNLDENEKADFARKVFDGFSTQVRDAVMVGLSQKEAFQSAVNMVRKRFTEENDAHATARADIVINKGDDPNGLGLTPEEHEKLERTKKVRLVLIEDQDLAHIKIERPSEQHKADYVRSIEGSLSKYQIPLPMLGDFITVKGAQIVQLINAINYDDSSLDEIINTKASLIYEKLIGGSILRRYDSEGKSTMSYQEFINKFAYQDIDIALYGILCASSMEETATSLTCQSCSHVWDQPYKLQSLLKLDHIAERYKDRVETILSNKSNDIALMKLYEDQRKARRYKSPFTSNIYDMSYPTVARAINLLKRIDQNDPVMTYVSAIGLYLSQVLVYNDSKESYVPVTAEETDLLLDVLQSLPNKDMEMLANQVRSDLFYEAKFEMPATCPSCHKTAQIPLGIENMVFLMARDSMVEIEQ